MGKTSRGWAALVLCLTAAAGWASAATNQTVITSKTLDFDYGRMIAVFRDNVVVVDPQMRMDCDQLTVIFERTNDVKSITAAGNVRVRHQDKTATGKKGIYLAREAKVLLIGDATLARGSDVVKGNEITFWLNEDRMEVGGGQATMVITPTSRGGGGLSRDLLKESPSKKKP